MDRPKIDLLKVWQAASQQGALAESLTVIADLVGARLPASGLAVLAFDWDKACLTVQATAANPIPGLGLEVRPLGAPERRSVATWAARAEVLIVEQGREAGGIARILLPRHPTGDWLIAPLGPPNRPIGALLAWTATHRGFDPSHIPVVTDLAAPLTVALDNDRRFDELERLREAADAERRSALTRLGRDDLAEAIVGAEAGLAPVMDRTTLAAKSDIPVLILGETGTGKEVIARAIHERSPRRDRPFIRVNCGAIPPELIDSQLFGHEKGAFTGAVATRRGWFERADQGTLLLDEIGELPLAAQTRLLRVLQEGTFERVGGEATIRVNVRIVASTHRDLPAMVQTGGFRPDLWYRIASFPIVLPPLRERRQDIGPLASYLAARAARRFGLRPIAPTPNDVVLLMGYPWPGNIRELASVIDRAAILGDGHTLEISRALGPGTQPPAGRPARPAPDHRSGPGATVSSLDDAIRAHIEAALALTRGRVEGAHGAAQLLRINPHTLRARMRKLKIDWGQFRAGPARPIDGGR